MDFAAWSKYILLSFRTAPWPTDSPFW